MILRPDFRTILPVQQQHGRIRHIQCRQRRTHKIIRTRTVYDIQFLIVPFHMIHCGKNRITVFLFHRKIVTHRVLGRNSSAALNQSGLIKQGFRECCFTGTIISQQGYVFNLVCLIYFHRVTFNLKVTTKRHEI